MDIPKRKGLMLKALWKEQYGEENFRNLDIFNDVAVYRDARNDPILTALYKVYFNYINDIIQNNDFTSYFTFIIILLITYSFNSFLTSNRKCNA